MDNQVNMDIMPLRWGHFRVLIIASIGQFMGSALATLVGVVIPFIQIISHPQLSSLQQGFLASAGLIGIMTGCILIGHLCDKYGYLSFFRLCPSIDRKSVG